MTRRRKVRGIGGSGPSHSQSGKAFLEGLPKSVELIYGVHPVQELIAAGRRKVFRLWVGRQSGDEASQQLLSRARDLGIDVHRDVERRVLEGLTQGAVGQSVVAATEPFIYSELEDIINVKVKGRRRRLILLDQIQDPQNLGAILRTAEVAGFVGAIIVKHGAVGVTPTVVKASAGASEHLPVAKVVNLASTMVRLKEAGYWVMGLDSQGRSIYELDLDVDLALVVGSEGTGIRPGVAKGCDEIVALPTEGRVSSLNASAAVAAAAFQLVRPSEK